MYHILSLAKFQFKLLLRNKGFLVFLILIPVLSVLLLNLKYSMLSDTPAEVSSVTDLDEPTTQLAYSADYDKLSVKILDCSDSRISDYLLDSLAQYGLFEIFRYSSDSDLSESEIDAVNTYSAEHDTVGCVLYLSPDLEQELLNASLNQSLQYYDTSDDARLDAFCSALDTELNGIMNYAVAYNHDYDQVIQALDKVQDATPDVHFITTNSGSGSQTSLSAAEENYVTKFKFSLSIISLSFIFCGIMISSSIIKEKENNVLTKILISRATMAQYLLSKLFVAVICILIQTFFIGISLKFVIHIDAYLNIWPCLFLIFGLGLILSALTLCTGILCSNTMSVNYICIAFWCISCLIGGLYFSLDHAGATFQYLSKLMPQYWTAKCMEMMISGDNNGYLLYILMIAAFLIVFGTIALLGTHLTRSDSADS